jgi:hypothetical protein
MVVLVELVVSLGFDMVVVLAGLLLHRLKVRVSQALRVRDTK